MDSSYLAKEQGIMTCESCWAKIACEPRRLITSNKFDQLLFPDKPQPL